MAAEGRKYNLRSIRAVVQTFSESDDDLRENVDSDDEVFVPSDTGDRDSEQSDDEENEDEGNNEQESDSDLEKESERATKRKRVSEAAERIRKRGRPRKSIPAKCGIKWSEIVPVRHGRRSSAHQTFEPSPANAALEIDSPLDAFQILFSKEIIDIIVLHTNEEIDREVARLRKDNLVVQSYHSHTTSDEINAYIGVLIFGAVFHQNKLSLDDIFSEHHGSGFCRAAFSEHRFQFLNYMVRFDDKSTREERRARDKLAPIREIWDMFIKNCTDSYEPSTDITIDEQLIGFRGRCCFRIYMKSKPDKYGLKVLMCNDAQTSYMISAIPYVGKVTPERGDSVPTYFVRKLLDCTSIPGTWRHITMDRWFTSVPLFEMLREKYQLRAVGTIQKNRTEIPIQMKTSGNVGTSKFVYTPTLTLVAYTPKANKIVLVLSSIHHDASINRTTGKPEMIMYYNAHKGGIDTFDQHCHTFNVARRTRRWPLKFFFNMINQATINAQILYNLKVSNEKLSRSKFLKNLAYALITPHAQMRLNSPTLRISVKNIISKVLKIDIPTTDVPNLFRDESQGRCALCSNEKTGKTRTRCGKCMRRICDEHRAGICTSCAIGDD
ncbi:uncharacterized protein [Venturia canescens]|nr:uncharacterized protein LOC122408105 isoform X1 [Venturia canescens]